MGSFVGHAVPGIAFLVLGWWHLFNHIKIYAQNPKAYTSNPWFPLPVKKLKYAELYFIMIGSSILISMELFIGPERHHPFDPDGTIPSNHLHNFEHSTMAMPFFVYALFALFLDRIDCKFDRNSLAHLLVALAFSQELLLFHLHSIDHMGIEGQYHLLLQIIVMVSLITTLIGIQFQHSFTVSLVRSASIFFQGVWFIFTGCMLWTPLLLPKGCFLRLEDGRQVVWCATEAALHRAKSLVTVYFNWLSMAVSILIMGFYLISVKFHGGRDLAYAPLSKEDEAGHDTSPCSP